MGAVTAAFVGGPYDGKCCALVAAPRQIEVAQSPSWHEIILADRAGGIFLPDPHVFVYERCDDPETGVYLGGYVYVRQIS